MDIEIVLLNEICRVNDNEILLTSLKRSIEDRTLLIPIYYWPDYFEEKLPNTGYKRIGPHRESFYIRQLKFANSLFDKVLGIDIVIIKGAKQLKEFLIEIIKDNEISIIRNRKNMGDIKKIHEEIREVKNEINIEYNVSISFEPHKKETSFCNFLHECFVRECIIKNLPIRNRSDFISRTISNTNYLISLLNSYREYKEIEGNIFQKFVESNTNINKEIKILGRKYSKQALSELKTRSETSFLELDPNKRFIDWLLDSEGEGIYNYHLERKNAEPNSSKLSPYIAFGSISQISIFYKMQYICLYINNLYNSTTSQNRNTEVMRSIFNEEERSDLDGISHLTYESLNKKQVKFKDFNEGYIKFLEELGDSSFNQLYIYKFSKEILSEEISLLYKQAKELNKYSEGINKLLLSSNRAINAIIEELLTTGYISNKCRMLLCNVAFKHSQRINFEEVRELLEHYLIDYIDSSTLYGVLWSIGVFDSLSINSGDIMTRRYSSRKFMSENIKYINNYSPERDIYSNPKERMNTSSIIEI